MHDEESLLSSSSSSRSHTPSGPSAATRLIQSYHFLPFLSYRSYKLRPLLLYSICITFFLYVTHSILQPKPTWLDLLPVLPPIPLSTSIPPSWPNPWTGKPQIVKKWLNDERFPRPESVEEEWEGDEAAKQRRKRVGLGVEDTVLMGLKEEDREFVVTDKYYRASLEYFNFMKLEEMSFVGRHKGRGESWNESDGRPMRLRAEDLYWGEKEGWKRVREGERKVLPRVQVVGSEEEDKRTKEDTVQDEQRREWVRKAFLHLWENYKKRSWSHDEHRPLSLTPSDPFTGYSSTIFDSLSTLLIFNLTSEYLLAREHIARVDFTFLLPKDPSSYPRPSPSTLPPLSALSPSEPILHTLPTSLKSPPSLPLFESVIRFLGSLLSAYDLSHDPLMLSRAEELGEWLLPSMGTKSGLARRALMLGRNYENWEEDDVVLAEAGSLGLEFTKLEEVTRRKEFGDAIARTTDRFDNWKADERVEGLFPTQIDLDNPTSLRGHYTFGGQADSYYEYLIKLHQLLRGSSSQYPRMYTSAIDSAHKHLIRSIEDVTGVEGSVTIGDVHFGELMGDPMMGGLRRRGNWYSTRLDHLTCFAGGMLGLGARLLARSKDFLVAQQFTNSCIWAYESTSSGLAPEIMQLWHKDDPNKWEAFTLPNGTRVKKVKGSPPGNQWSSNYHIQRPETIESVFYMYRLTGSRHWQEKGWKMFTSWVAATICEGGFAHISDVNSARSRKDDSGVESFVYAETLKYYYLLFSPPTLLSLDSYVFTTEAHPLRIPPLNPSKSHFDKPPPFWNERERLKMPEGPIGEGTTAQKWVRVLQAAWGRGWRWEGAEEEGGKVPGE